MKNNFLFVFVDRQHGHFSLFDATTKQLTKLAEISDDVPKPVKSASWKGLANDKVARHIEGHIHAHLQTVVAKLEQLRKDYPETALVLGGPEEVVAEFHKLLPKPLEQTVVATLHPDHHANAKELEDLLSRAVEGFDSNEALVVMEEIENDRRPGGRGVVGREAVCEALNLGQVQTLLIHLGSAYAGNFCPVDGAVSCLLTQCPNCLRPLQAVPDISRYLQAKAAEQSANVIEVTDRKLFAVDGEGLAALRRY